MRKPIVIGMAISFLICTAGFATFGWIWQDTRHTIASILCAICFLLSSLVYINPVRHAWAMRILAGVFSASILVAVVYDLATDMSLINIFMYILPVELFMVSVLYAVRGDKGRPKIFLEYLVNMINK